MKCAKCGSDIPEGKKFCENCGAPLEEATAGPPLVPPAPPLGAGRPSGGSTVLIISTVIALVLGLAIGGLAAWLITRDSDTATASIESMNITLEEGGKVDLKEVSYKETLKTTVNCRATYESGGRAALLLTWTRKDGKVIHEKSFALDSSGKVQKKTYYWRMEEYDNNPYVLTASVFSGKGDDTVMAERSIEYRVVKGQAAEEETGEDTGDNGTTEEPPGDVATLKKQVEDMCSEAFADAYAMDPSGADPAIKKIMDDALNTGAQARTTDDLATLQSLFKQAQDLEAQVEEIKKQKGLNF